MKKIQSSYDYDDLIISGEKSLFGPGNAKLPLPPMLMLDRITHMDDNGGPHGKGQVIAELEVNPDLWFFECHFKNDPDDPVMPGCLGLDAMWQLVGFWLGWSGSPGRGRALGVGEVKFTGQVTPDIKKVRYEIELKRVIRRRAGKCGITKDEKMAELGFRSQISGRPADTTARSKELIGKRSLRFMADAAEWSALAMHDAIADAKLTEEQVSSERTGIIAGSGGPSAIQMGHLQCPKPCPLRFPQR